MKSLHTEIMGQGETIILVHGWAMHSGIWRDFALKLAEQCQVILVDLPGHGQSDAIECFDLEHISHEIIKVVPSRPCCWLGWSLGATIVLDINQRFPERGTALILLAGNPHFTQTENWPGMSCEFLQAFKSSIDENGEAALLRFLLLQLQGTSEAKALGIKLKQLFLQFKIPTKKTLLDGLDVLRDADLRPALSAANCPVAFILGVKDGLVPVSVGELLNQIRPASYLNIIKGAGHVPFLSHPQQVINVIQKVMS